LSMDSVDRFLKAYNAVRVDRSDEKLYQLLEALLPFSPPGIEWGLEVANIAGVTYMLEGGRVIAVKVSRDEFGPFMQTSVAEISLTSIPSAALKNIKDVESFIDRVVKHLSEWASRMPADNSLRRLVEELLKNLPR